MAHGNSVIACIDRKYSDSGAVLRYTYYIQNMENKLLMLTIYVANYAVAVLTFFLVLYSARN
jgi:hypothetical protein